MIDERENRTETDKLVEKMANDGLGRIFDATSPEERKNEIMNRFKDFDFVTQSELDRAEEILVDAETITDREVFITKGIAALSPLIEHVKNDPESFQRAQQDRNLESENKVRINELLYYHLDEEQNLHLHVLPNQLTVSSEKLRSLRSGLTLTAQILVENPEIKNVEAESWIVAENPKLLEMLDFTIHGKVASNDEREVWRASISREDFIAKHLK